MYYSDNYFGPEFDANQSFMPQQAPQQQQPQQGMGGIDPMQALQAYQTFSGGGLGGMMGGGGGTASIPGGALSSFGTGASAPAGGALGLGGAGTGAAGGGAAAGGSAGGGATAALASNPISWIAAAALAQNVMHNKDIASWQSALKGQAGGNMGSHFLDQWGVDDDSAIRDVAGVLGFEKEGGGIFNPNYLSKKIFGSVD